MVRTVYVDLLFLINFSMDFLCFFLTARLLGRRIPVLRTVLASALGGAYAVGSLFLPFGGVPLLLCDLLACVVMCLCVRAGRGVGFRNLLTEILLYTGVSMALGGIMTALYSLLNETAIIESLEGESDDISAYLFLILAALGGGASLVGSRLVRHRATDKLYRVGFSLSGKTGCVEALVDTGNRLRDPLTGLPAVGISPELLTGILPLSVCKGNGNPGETMMGELPPELRVKARLLPVRTASGEGLLLAFRPDYIWVGKEENRINMLIALFPVEISGVKAILPPDAMPSKDA